jgi:hypothetical protein
MIKVRTKILNGKISENIPLMQEALRLFDNEDVTIIIEKTKRKRSGPQNAFYWGCVLPYITWGIIELGNEWTDEDSHILMRSKFLQKAILINDDGEFVTKTKSTTELDTVQWEEYITKIRAWASEMLNIEIPLPNEYIESNPK